MIPDWRTKILHAAGQLSLHTPTRETTCSGALVPHLLSLGFPEPTRHSWRSPLAITETQCSPQIKKTKLINQALSKLKLLYTKDIIKKIKRQQNGRKSFANHIDDTVQQPE